MRIHDVTRPVFSREAGVVGRPSLRCGWSVRLPDDGVNAAELSFGAHTPASRERQVSGAGAPRA